MTQSMQRVIENVPLADPGSDLVQIDIVDIGARETDLFDTLIESTDQMLMIRERVPWHHPPQGIALRDDEPHHKGGQPVTGIVPEVILQKERERVQRTSLQGIQRLRIIEIQTKIVGFMQNPPQGRLDDLEGIVIDRGLRLIRKHREMIDKKMTQGVGIPLFPAEPFSDPKGQIL
ncbi:MAG: hypothetical protein WAN16_10305 [Chthoniobacterales bacterium]